MAQFVDTAVEVVAVTNDLLKLRVGPSTMEVTKAQLKELMDTGAGGVDTMIANIAISLALAGISIEDDVSLKREIERRAFKLFR